MSYVERMELVDVATVVDWNAEIERRRAECAKNGHVWHSKGNELTALLPRIYNFPDMCEHCGSLR